MYTYLLKASKQTFCSIKMKRDKDFKYREAHSCNGCGKLSPTQSLEKFHVFQHCGVSAFNRYVYIRVQSQTCNECGKSFKETGNLKRHRMILSMHVVSFLIRVVT